MSAIVIQQHLTHYEIIGRGQPILFLHSWLGSWRTWMPMMEMVADRYRAISLDFWGFGDSAKGTEPVDIDRYVEQVYAFVQALGMLPPHLVGHGLGGIVAIRAASQHPETFGKVLITGTPILGAHIQVGAKPSGLGRLLNRGSGNDLWIKMVREAANGEAAFDEIMEDIEATNPETLQLVMEAVSAIDLRADLDRVAQPLLAIYGARDRILTAQHGQHINEAQDRFRQVLIFDKSGHFPFIDQPAQFSRAMLEFFSGSNHTIELKEMWKRRVNALEFL